MISCRLQRSWRQSLRLLKSARFLDVFGQLFLHFPEKYFPAALAAVALLGLGLALLRSSGALTVDEPTSANVAHAPLVQAMAQIKSNNDTLLYLLSLKLWTKVFGESELALRSFSALCFALTILVVGLTAARLRSTFTGLIAAGLAAASFNTGLTFASMARAYALLTLITSLAMYWFFSLAELYASERKASAWAMRVTLFTALLTAGLLTHPLFAFFILALVIASILISFRFFVRMVGLAGIAVAVFLIIWGTVLIEHSKMGFPATAWMMPPRPRNLLQAYLNLWGKMKTVLIMGLCVLSLAVACWREWRFSLYREEAICLTIVVLCGLGVYSYSHLMTPIFHGTRTPAVFLATSCLLAALLLTRPLGYWAQGAAYVVVAALMMDAAINVYQEIKAPPPFSVRSSVAVVLDQADCEDVLVASGESYSEIAYYLRRLDAPACLRLMGFPSDIERHMGWVDAFRLLENPDALDQEIEQLVFVLLQSRWGARIWLFRSQDPTFGHKQVADRLTARLDALMGEAQLLDLRGSFFDQVWVYRVR